MKFEEEFPSLKGKRIANGRRQGKRFFNEIWKGMIKKIRKMKFEEQFPSFKSDSRWFPIFNSSVAGWSEDAIKEHCLDKKRVKEVVTAYLCKYVCRNERIKKLRDGILKELGLSEAPAGGSK